jgi:hypothetical protein
MLRRLTLFHFVRDVWRQLLFCPLAADTENAHTRYIPRIKGLPFVPQGYITHLRYNAPGVFTWGADGGQIVFYSRPRFVTGCCYSDISPNNEIRLSILWSSIIAFCVKSFVSSFLANNQLDAQFFFHIYIYIYSNSLYVSSTLVIIIRRINCINTTSGIYVILRR